MDEKILPNIKEEIEENISMGLSRMLSAYTAYNIWKYLKQSLNPNEVGIEEAKIRADILNGYNFLFQQITDSVYKTFINDLAIFYDQNIDDRFSLLYILKKLKKNNYDIGGMEDIIDKKKRENKEYIKIIRDQRNGVVSHLDPKLYHESLTIEFIKIEDLFKITQEIFDLLRNKISDYRITTDWSHIPRIVKEDIDLLFNNLDRGEKMRVNEIELKYKQIRENGLNNQ